MTQLEEALKKAPASDIVIFGACIKSEISYNDINTVCIVRTYV